MIYDLNVEFLKIKEAFERVKKDVKKISEENKLLIKKIEKQNSIISNCCNKNNKPKNEDLTKIEGIGHVIKKLFRKNQIRTFEDLANSKVNDLRKILDDAKLQFHEPKTWPKQAKLANKGKWEELEEWQDILIGGK